jgi:hypothetical protein
MASYAPGTRWSMHPSVTAGCCKFQPYDNGEDWLVLMALCQIHWAVKQGLSGEGRLPVICMKLISTPNSWRARVIPKIIIFWDITLCIPPQVNRLSGGTYRLHFQGRISRAKYQRESRWQAEWRWRRYVPPERRLACNGIHGVISQKVVLFITTAVRTSYPTGVIPFEKVFVGKCRMSALKDFSDLELKVKCSRLKSDRTARIEFRPLVCSEKVLQRGINSRSELNNISCRDK